MTSDSVHTSDIQATGLTLPGGDLDVVILGVGSELQTAGSGFSGHEVH